MAHHSAHYVLVGGLASAAATETLPRHDSNAVFLLIGGGKPEDTPAKTLRLDNGDTVTYETLLAATGTSPETADIPGTDGPDTQTLRTWQEGGDLGARAGQKVVLAGDPQGGTGGLFHGDPASDRFDELFVDDKNQVVRVISVNPPADLYETLEQLPRVKPPVDGLEDDIRQADFDLNLLLALD